jgi:hypothetical protein
MAKKYKLVSPSKPPLRDGGNKGSEDDFQEPRIWKAIAIDLNGGPATEEEIIEACRKRKYESLLHDGVTIQESIVGYHLPNFIKRRILTVEYS